jgi:hypothetical protein
MLQSQKNCVQLLTKVAFQTLERFNVETGVEFVLECTEFCVYIGYLMYSLQVRLHNFPKVGNKGYLSLCVCLPAHVTLHWMFGISEDLWIYTYIYLCTYHIW